MPGRSHLLPSPRTRSGLARRILAWFDRSGRKLPWRDDPSPYRVWVSEIMAQQTRIQVVESYFLRFMERFPTLDSLAAGSIDDVLSLWSGLGYYSRARNLHRTARLVLRHFAGELPRDPSLLQSLPGIGRYTAGAIASIAYQVMVPVLDGNVIRVLSRVFDIDRDVAMPSTREHLWSLAACLVPPRSPGRFNEGLMELGALVCLPSSPRCGLCPVRRMCQALRAGTHEERPVKRRKQSQPVVSLRFGLVRDARERILLVQNDYSGLFGGLWMLPSASGSRTALREVFLQGLGLRVRQERLIGRTSHVLTHRHLRIRLYACRAASSEVHLRGYRDCRWVRGEKDLAGLGLPRLTRKLLELADQAGEKTQGGCPASRASSRNRGDWI